MNDDPDTLRQQLAAEKFDTCKYRSKKPEETGGYCCGSKLVLAYICYMRNIEGVSEGHCQDCQRYKKRKILNEEE